MTRLKVSFFSDQKIKQQRRKKMEKTYTLEQLLEKKDPLNEEEKEAGKSMVKELDRKVKELTEQIELARKSRGSSEASMTDDQYFQALAECDGLKGKRKELKAKLKGAAIVVVAPSEKDPEKEPEKEPKKDPEKDPEKEPEKEPKKDPEKEPEKEPKKDPEKEPEKEPKKDPEKEPEKDPKKESDVTIGGEQPSFDIVDVVLEGDDDDGEDNNTGEQPPQRIVEEIITPPTEEEEEEDDEDDDDDDDDDDDGEDPVPPIKREVLVVDQPAQKSKNRANLFLGIIAIIALVGMIAVSIMLAIRGTEVPTPTPDAGNVDVLPDDNNTPDDGNAVVPPVDDGNAVVPPVDDVFDMK
jgi:hypothetical protein